MSSLSDLGATELLAGFARGDFRPSEAVDATAAAIAQRDPALRAFAALCLDRAREEARRADAAWSSGTARTLEGVPLAVKDLMDVAGVETTYGSPMFRGHVPDADAAAVAAARAAGAIVVGKTATHEFAWGITSHNAHFDWGRNPWSPDRVTGGSSGGSAAALATGMVPLALGTDTGGSIRVPAAYCGVAGHKPTFGLVPTDGVFPLSPSLDHVGPLARTPGDARLLLAALGGVTPGVPRADVAGLRLGLCSALVPPLDDAVRTSFDAAVDALVSLGMRVVECAVAGADEILPTFAVVQPAEAIRVHRAAGLWPARRAEYGADVRGRLELAEAVGLDDYAAAISTRERIRAAFVRVFAGVDVLLTPVTAGPPPLRGEDEVDHRGERIAFRQLVMPMTTPQDLVGLPSTVVRSGFDALGIPSAVQITAAPGADALALAVGEALWAATPEVQATRPPVWR